MRGENWAKMQENRKWENRTAGDLSVIVDRYVWQLLNNDYSTQQIPYVYF